MQNNINILWTGGLDSTFLLVSICRAGGMNTIQPVYVIDPTRGSVKEELCAIRNITQLIRKQVAGGERLLDVITVKVSDIASDSVITQAHAYLHEKYSLGTQYDWLARYAKQQNLNLMVGVQMESRGKVVHTLEGVSLNKVTIANIDCLTVNEVDQLNQCAKTVFEHLLFPCLIVGTSKVQEWKLLQKWGLEELAHQTWFCHQPVLGMPCGQCNPCKDAINEDMAWRVPYQGRILGWVRKQYRRLSSRFNMIKKK